MITQNIAVHGATGSQGAPVVRQLIRAGHRVRAVTRRASNLPAGVESVAADLLDVDALVAAYDGMDAVVLQLPLLFDETSVRQARAVLAALGKSSVRRVVFNTGGPIPDGPVGVPFIDSRALLRAELANTVETASLVAPAATYAENLVAPWSLPALDVDEVRYPVPADIALPWVAGADVATAIGDLLVAARPAPVQLVSGPAALTGEQVAAELSAGLGRPVRWQTITPTAYGEMLRPHVGPDVAAGIVATYEAGGIGSGIDPSLVRTGTTRLRDWAATVPADVSTS